jgi:hypothetical protein
MNKRMMGSCALAVVQVALRTFPKPYRLKGFFFLRGRFLFTERLQEEGMNSPGTLIRVGRRNRID